MTYDNRDTFIDPVLSAYTPFEPPAPAQLPAEPKTSTENQIESQRDYWIALLVTLTLVLISGSVFTVAIARFSEALLVDAVPRVESQGQLAQWLSDEAL